MLSSSSATYSTPSSVVPSRNNSEDLISNYGPLLYSDTCASDAKLSANNLLMAEPFYPLQNSSAGITDYSQQEFASQASPFADSDDYYHPPGLPQGFSHSPAWPTHSNGSLHPNSASHGLIPFQQQSRHPHRRALSNSSIGSFAPDSPYSAASSIQYPAPVPSSSQHPSGWEDYGSPAAAMNHLPTPSHTPMRDTFMEDGGRKPSSMRPEDSGSSRRSALNGVPTPHFNGAGRQDWPTSLQAENAAENTGEIKLDWIECVQLDDCLPDCDAVSSRNVPTLDRTISDICQDELYNPAAAINPQAARPPQLNTSYLSPQPSTVSERVQAAQRARSSSPYSAQQRDPSPFVQSSRFAPSDFNQYSEGMRTAASLREQQKRESDVIAYRRHHQPPSNVQPTTVSPKDAFPAQQEPEGDDMPSLFPQTSTPTVGVETPAYGPHDANMASASFNFGSLSGFLPQTTPSGEQRPDLKYPSQHFQQDSSSNDMRGQENQMPNYPPQLNSMPSTKTDDDDQDSSPVKMEKPEQSNSGTGTYSCTYHGCTERFETPAKLQKHKREGHRSTGAQSIDMTQAGPHRCIRINPGTGKPCNTVFSRPYDLTRHEQSLHAPNKKKLRCPYCTEEKLFSRADALTRHSRVVHSTQAWPGKQRRRPGHQ